MAQWQRCLDIKDVWASGNIYLIASALSERLRRLEPFGDDALDGTRDELADRFADLANATMQYVKLCGVFYDIMEELYDWADTALSPGLGKKACWISTVF